jgi:hypothetical protein
VRVVFFRVSVVILHTCGRAVPNGYVWHETTYASLSIIARAITGTRFFFGLRSGAEPRASSEAANVSPAPKNKRRLVRASKCPSEKKLNLLNLL